MTHDLKTPSWLDGHVVWRRWHVLLAAAIIGLLCALALIIGANAISDVRGEKTRAIASETLSKSQIEKLVRRLVRLEQPSAEDIVKQIRRSLRVCFTDQHCRVILIKTIHETETKFPSSGASSRAPAPSRTPNRQPNRQSSDRPPRSPSVAPKPPTNTPGAPPNPPSPAITTPSITTPVVTVPSVTVPIPCVKVKLPGVDITGPAC